MASVKLSLVTTKLDVGCTLNVRHLAENSHNVQEKVHVVKIRFPDPWTSAKLYPSGIVVCRGKSRDVKEAPRMDVAHQNKIGYKATLKDVSVSQVKSTVKMQATQPGGRVGMLNFRLVLSPGILGRVAMIA